MTKIKSQLTTKRLVYELIGGYNVNFIITIFLIAALSIIIAKILGLNLNVRESLGLEQIVIMLTFLAGLWGWFYNDESKTKENRIKSLPEMDVYAFNNKNPIPSTEKGPNYIMECPNEDCDSWHIVDIRVAKEVSKIKNVTVWIKENPDIISTDVIVSRDSTDQLRAGKKDLEFLYENKNINKTTSIRELTVRCEYEYNHDIVRRQYTMYVSDEDITGENGEESEILFQYAGLDASDNSIYELSKKELAYAIWIRFLNAIKVIDEHRIQEEWIRKV